MTIQIQTPDGGVAHFPDGTAPDVMERALQEKFGGPSTKDAAPGLSAGDVAADVAKSGGIGVGKGLLGLAGMAGDLDNLLAKGDHWRIDGSGIHYGPAPGGETSMPTSASLQKRVEGYTGEFYKPKSTAGEYAQTAGEFLPAVIGGPETLAMKLATRVAAPAIASEAAGQLTKGTTAEPYARVAAAVAGGLAPGMLARTVTPITSSPERQRLVQILQDEGVTSLTAGQRTGNKALQYAESILGDAPGAGQGASRVQQEGQRQFTEAAMRRTGGGPNAGPEALADNNQRLGDTFRDLSARNTLTPDNHFINDITTAVRDYRNVPNSQQRQIVQGYIDDIVDHVNAGQMPGEMYQEMRSRLSRQSKAYRNNDPALSDALRDMRNALDDAMERSIPTGSQDAALWRQARREYGAQKTIETAASRAGEATAEGQIVPANLRNAVTAQNRGAYARGEGDFSELARAGSGVMAPLPNSGTGQRVAIHSLTTGLGGGGGSLLGPAAAMLGAAAGAALPAAVGRVLMSRPAQAWLGNSLINLENLPPARRQAVMSMLLSQQRAPLFVPSRD